MTFVVIGDQKKSRKIPQMYSTNLINPISVFLYKSLIARTNKSKYLIFLVPRSQVVSTDSELCGSVCHPVGDHVGAILELFRNQTTKIDKETQYTGSLGKDKSITGKERFGKFAGGWRNLLW